jgi:hypothetical protein
LTTMLRVYTAWADRAIETDIEAIKRAKERRPASLTDEARAVTKASRHPPN